jgi:hypothetical protein
MLALRRVGEATLLRDSDKIPELMNSIVRSDTPLGPPVCLRLADRMGAVAKGVRTGVLLIAEQNAAFAEQSRWSTSLPSDSLRMNNVSAAHQDLQRFRYHLDNDRSDRECGDFCGIDRIADASGTAPHRAARYALRHCHPGCSGGGGTNCSRRHRDSSALALAIAA